uniref:Uncharacterized protein n=1 Tax=Arundo donax TaxID=35708 RepID=A0A0A9GP06_ARUDO
MKNKKNKRLPLSVDRNLTSLHIYIHRNQVNCNWLMLFVLSFTSADRAPDISVRPSFSMLSDRLSWSWRRHSTADTSTTAMSDEETFQLSDQSMAILKADGNAL